MTDIEFVDGSGPLITRAVPWSEQTCDMTTRLSIGDFSRMTYLSVKALRRYHEMGFRLHATEGTGAALARVGVASERVFKLSEGRPNGLDLLVNGTVGLLINTPRGKSARDGNERKEMSASAGEGRQNSHRSIITGWAASPASISSA